LNAGERLQTFPYPTIPRLFPHSKAFTVNAQTLLFESVTDKQKNNKNINFFDPGGTRYPRPTKLGMVIEDVRTLLAPLIHVRLQRTVRR